MTMTNQARSRLLPPAVVAAFVSAVVAVAISSAWTVARPQPNPAPTATGGIDRDELGELIREEVAAALDQRDLAETGDHGDAMVDANLDSGDSASNRSTASRIDTDPRFDERVAEALERELERRARRARQAEVEELARDFERVFEDVAPYEPDTAVIERLRDELARIGAQYVDGHVDELAVAVRDATGDLRESLKGSLKVGDDEIRLDWTSGPFVVATRYGRSVAVGAPVATRWLRSDAMIHAVRIERDGLYTASVDTGDLTLRLLSDETDISLDRSVATTSRTFITGWLEAGDYELHVTPRRVTDPRDITLHVTERPMPVVQLGQPIAVDIEPHADAVFEYTVDSEAPLVFELVGLQAYDLHVLDEFNEAVTPLVGSSHRWPEGRWIIRVVNLDDRSAHGALTINLGD